MGVANIQHSGTPFFSRVRVINAFELGNLEAHHLSGGLAHEFLLAFAVGVLGDYFARHFGVLWIGDGVNGEKLDLIVIQPIVPAQGSDMLFGVAHTMVSLTSAEARFSDAEPSSMP